VGADSFPANRPPNQEPKTVPTLPLHPALVHLPLGIAMVLPLVAFGLALAVLTRRLPRGAFAILLALQALLVASGLLSMNLGERDSKRVERLVSERLVEVHEERAEAFVWAGGVVLAGAAALLLVPAASVTGVAAVVVAGTLVVAGLGLWTGEAGGALVYTHGAAAAWAPAGAAPAGPAVPAAVHDDD
jgi:uncharacterized membrane protein